MPRGKQSVCSPECPDSEQDSADEQRRRFRDSDIKSEGKAEHLEGGAEQRGHCKEKKEAAPEGSHLAILSRLIADCPVRRL